MTHANEIAIKDEQKLAFLGDSITQEGWERKNGYVKLVALGLHTNGIKVEPIAAGIGGHKSNNMLQRLERDVLSRKPDWMTLSCGVNDVWHGEKGVPLPEYKDNIRKLVDQAQAAGVRVMILTATPIGEELDNENNKKLAPYNEFLRELGKEKKCLVADVSSMFQETIREGKQSGKEVTRDGVHLNEAGDRLMAVGILKAFGLNDDGLAKARQAWALEAQN
ncbi:MAG: SGNH/GDSL hydrolase family protein [Verrucomicrobiales bacterium]